MPNEEIKYTFTGDASKLQQASQQAIDALKNVEKAEQTTDTNANFSNTISQVKGLTSAYTSLLGQLNLVNSNMLITTQSCANISQGLMAVNFIIKETVKSIGQLTSSMQAIPLGTTQIAGAIPQVSSAFAQYSDALRNAFLMQQQGQSTATLLASGLMNIGTTATALIPEVTSASTGLMSLSSSCTALVPIISQVSSTISPWASLFATLKKGVQEYANSHYNLTSAIINALPAMSQEGNMLSHLGQIISNVSKTMGKNAISRYINSHNNLLSAVLKTIPGIKEYSQKVNEADKETKKHSDSTSKLGSGFSKLLSPLKSATKSVANLIAQYINLRQVITLIKNCISASNDWIESLNLFSVASGKYYDSMKANIDSLSYYAGASEKTLMDAAGSFKLFTSEMGIAADTSAKMSNSLTNLTVDMASLYNKDFSEVATDLQSGLQGMTKSVRKYGIDISSAALQETALQQGITKEVSAMTQAEKAQLRYIQILKQTTLSQGDFARTIQTPANMLKILKDQIRQCAVYLGNLFQPVLQTILPFLIKFTFVIQNICKWLATLVGYDASKFQVDTSGMEAGSAAMAENVEDTAKSAKDVKKQLAGFDELNVISQDTGSAGSSAGGIGGGAPVSFDIPNYDSLLSMTDFLPKLREQAASISQKFQDWLNPILQAFQLISGPLRAAGDSLKTSFGEIGKTFANFVQQDLIQNVAPALGNIASIVATLVSSFSKLFKALEPVALVLSGIVWDVITNALQLISDVLDIIANTFTTFSGPLTTTMESVRTAVKNIWKALAPVITGLVEMLLPPLLNLITSILPPLTNAIQVIVELAADIIKSLMPIVSCLIDFLAPIIEVIVNTISMIVGIVAPIISICLKLLNFVLTPIVAIIKVLIAVNNTILKVVSTVVQSIQKVIGGMWQWLDKKIKGFLNGFIGFINKILGGVEKGINFILGGVNKVIGWLNKIPGFNISEIHVSIPKIGSFATGGFPEDGLFFANHNELVGKFTNGATAVANNEQIIEGIEGGVERGMLKAMRSGTSPQSINIYLDKDVLYKAVVEKNNEYIRRTGRNALSPA